MGSYGRIIQGGSGFVKGIFSISNDEIEWTNPHDGKKNSIAASDIVSASWISAYSGSILKLALKGGASMRYIGFKIKDLDDFKKHFTEHFKVNIVIEKQSSSGHNWGIMGVDDNTLSLVSSGTKTNTMIEMPMSDVTQCAVPISDEIEIQFSEENADAKAETVISMSFYIPEDAAIDGVEITKDDDADENLTPAQCLQKEIVERCGLGTNTGDTIVEFDERIGNFVTPRGRYRIEMYAKELRLHGKTYDYTIQYKSISKLFLLPVGPGKFAFVISLSVPVRQGAQRYGHLVMNLSDDQYIAQIHLTQEKINELYGEGKLAPEAKGDLHKVVAKVFKTLTSKRIFTVNTFKSKRGDRSVRCTLKSNEGRLFPLGKSFFFIHKPCTYIPFDSIISVEFQRYEAGHGGMHSRTFDLNFTCKAAPGTTTERNFTFQGIGRAEYNPLFGFLREKGINIRNIRESATGVDVPDDEGSEADSDFTGGEEDESSSDDEDWDASGDIDSGDEEIAKSGRKKKKAKHK